MVKSRSCRISYEGKLYQVIDDKLHHNERGQGHVTQVLILKPNHIFGTIEARRLKYGVCTLILMSTTMRRRRRAGSFDGFKFSKTVNDVSVTVRDWSITNGELRWKTKRKSYVAYRTEPMSMTLSYIGDHFIGSRPSDHYFRSVCMSVCLFVCAEFFSAVFDPISIKLGHMLCVLV